MKDYHPRRSSKEIRSSKEKLSVLEKKLRSDVEELLTSLRSGAEEKVKVQSQKMQSTLSSLTHETEGVALTIGTPYPKMVHAFLTSINKILQAEAKSTHSPYYSWVDEEKVKNFYTAARKLETRLSK